MMRISDHRSRLFPIGFAVALVAVVTGGVAVTQARSGKPAGEIAQATQATPRATTDIDAPDGFKVELLLKTDKPNQGSWVALCKGPNGTLFAIDQYNVKGQALYQIKPPAIGDAAGKTVVTPQPVKLAGAQGLYYGFGALYVMESGKGNGLVRVTDSDGDGLYDKKELILAVHGGGEHGTHAIVPTPDGKGLYIIAGNMTAVPKLDASRVPQLWEEDQLLKREPDARGHASRVMAPGGWICRIDPDGKNVTLHCNGFRNAYDMDVHPNGELFTYDSDMEWDLGLPWYRPTRVNHAVSGAEFGWRNGSGKWPTYYEDSLGGVVDIGPGSPVGVLFGTGAKFPTKYQSALFCLDWTYGTIYAIHLTPDGASYTGERESFVFGKPLPVTDAAIADDGAMYFTTGGRRGDSALYRVTYTGSDSTAAPTVAPLTELAKLRKELETLHAPGAGADKLDMIWSVLGHTDRHIRFAARVALEHLNPASYAKKAAAEKDPLVRTAAGLALARHKSPMAGQVLMGVDLSNSNEVTKLAWLRTVGVHLARGSEKLDQGTSDKLQAKILELADDESPEVKVEVARLRIYLGDKDAVNYAVNLMNTMPAAKAPFWLELAAKNDRYGPAIAAMRDNPPPINQFNIAFMLRNVTEGWTIQTRQAYFAWLNRATLGGGGNSYQGYIKKVREQAIATLSANEKDILAALLIPPTIDPKYPPIDPKGPGPKKWTVAMATKLVDGKLKNRDFKKGIGLFQAVTCSACHRVGDFGGQIGPDLSSVGNKFGMEDLMRTIVEPNHEVSDQYALTTVKTKDGKTIVGQMIEGKEGGVTIKPDVTNDKKLTFIPQANVKSVETSKLSPMPSGLINGMSANELRDLTAYLLSKGDPKDPMFKQD